MKAHIEGVLLACALLVSASQAPAQFFSIDWFTVGGGSTSVGATFSLSGTIGQTDAGTMSSESYSLVDGFWRIVSVMQTPGAPLLTIRPTVTNSVVILWPSPSTGFTLQENGNLSAASWATPSEAVTDNGTNKFIIVKPPTGSRFYRLFKP